MLVLLLLVGGLIGCQEEVSSKATVRVRNLQLIQRSGGSRYVQGEVYNGGEKPVPYVEIEISLFDAKNRKVETLRVDVRDIPPGKAKAFRKVIDSDKDIQGARIRRILIF